MDNKLKTVDAETLLSTPMSKTMFIVDGLISQGVNVISGASKIGKSWLMLWLGLQVAQGNSIWGLPTLQCDVLYLSLEDTQRRIKDRLYNLTDSAPDNLYFAVTSGLIGGGLEEQITDFLTEHSANRLFRYGKRHSQHMEKQRAAFPRPANSVSHSSIRQPVTHIPTTPTTTEAQPILPVIQKEIF